MENNMPAPRGAEVWRDYVTDGVPSSGRNEPAKADARAWSGWLESLVTSGVLSSGPWFATRETMALGYDANTIAVVYDDPTAAENGLYIKVGASGSGSWSQITTFLPGYQFVTASPTGASTANAIVATTSPRLPAGDGVALVTLPVPHTNTAAAVTVAFDGGTALTIKTRSGENPAIGELQAGDMLAGFVSGSAFRLITDLNSLQNAQAAQAAQAAAEAARDLAEAHAGDTVAQGNVPIFDSRDTASTYDLSAFSVVRINRFSSSSVVAPAVYEEVPQPANVEPAHAGKFQSDDGKWWEISKGQRITPPMIGATGLGLVDDTDAFMDAITAVVTLGVPLHDDGGIYLVSGTNGAVSLRVPDGADFTFQGAGRSKTVIKSVSPAAIIGGVDLEGFDVTEVGYEGGGTSSRLAWQRAIRLHGVRRLRVEGCYFKDIGDGPILIGRKGFGGSDQLPDGSRQCEMVQISGNLIEGGYGTVAICTKYVGAKQMIVSGNIIRDCCSVAVSIESEEGTIGVEYAEQVIVSDNVISGCSYERTSGFSNVAWGISITEQAKIITVTGNTVNGVLGNTVAGGIAVGTSPEQTDTEATDITVTGNVVCGIATTAGNSNAIMVSVGDADVKRLAITGNIADDARYGISLWPATGSKTLGTIRSMSIVGNVATRCVLGITHVNVGGSGEIPVEDATVSGNVATDCTSHGIQLSIRNGSITGNVANRNGGSGFSLLATGKKVSVVGNSACDNDANGFIGEGDRVLYIGNTCMNNGQGGTESYGIRHNSGAYCALINNRCGDDQGTATQDYGIRAPAGSTVKGNELIGNVSGTVWGGIASHNTGTYDAGGTVRLN